MYVGTRGHDFDANSIEELAKKCKQFNIHHVQLALKKSISGFKEGSFSEEYARSIGEELKKNDIRVSVLGCYINPSDTNEEQLKKSLDFFVENLHYAKYIGADMVGLETGFVGEILDIGKNRTEEAYQYLLKNMKYLCSEAEKLGVKIGIEGVSCFVIHSPEMMRRLVDDLNSDNVCVIFDPVNYIDITNYKNQSEIFDKYFELLANDTAVMHLKDYRLDGENLTYAYPNTGLLNTAELIKKMNAIKPEIAVILEEVREDKLTEIKKEIEKLI